MRADRLLHPIVQLGLAPPAFERRLRVAVVGHLRDQRFVGANRAVEVAEPVLNLTEQRARLRQLRVERERALELVPRVGVAPFERRRHPGAESQPRVLRVERNRLAERLGRLVHSAGIQRLPRAALEQRRPRIDLRRRPGDRRDRQHQRGEHALKGKPLRHPASSLSLGMLFLRSQPCPGPGPTHDRRRA